MNYIPSIERNYMVCIRHLQILPQFLEQIQMLTTINFLNFYGRTFIFLPRYLSVAIFDLNNERFRTSILKTCST